MGMAVFQQKEPKKMPGAHKIGAAIFMGTRNCGQKFYGHHAFSDNCLVVSHSPTVLIAEARGVPLRAQVLAGPKSD